MSVTPKKPKYALRYVDFAGEDFCGLLNKLEGHLRRATGKSIDGRELRGTIEEAISWYGLHDYVDEEVSRITLHKIAKPLAKVIQALKHEGNEHPVFMALLKAEQPSEGLEVAIERTAKRRLALISDLEKIAAKVDQVTPPNGVILSDEQFYFITRRPPPSGMELADSHKLEFPPERANPLHLVPESEVIKQVKAGRFNTVVNCDKNVKLTDEDLAKLYANHQDSDDTCNVYWNFRWRRL